MGVFLKLMMMMSFINTPIRFVISNQQNRAVFHYFLDLAKEIGVIYIRLADIYLTQKHVLLVVSFIVSYHSNQKKLNFDRQVFNTCVILIEIRRW